MKKLIEELEIKLNSESVQWCNREFSDGFKCALQIVKAHDPWHGIEKDGLPEPDKLLWFLCRDGSVFLGYYASFREEGETNYLWSVLDYHGGVYREGNEIIVETAFDDDYDVTHYRYIPTDLPEVSK